MKIVKAVLDGQEILQKVYVANHFFSRLKGLMFRKSLETKTGMLIRPCRQIHTFGMKFAIDAVFLTKDCRVVHVESAMPPRRISPGVAKGWQVLELAAGGAGGIKTGSRILFER